jgi:pilus assembly protein CpaF
MAAVSNLRDLLFQAEDAHLPNRSGSTASKNEPVNPALTSTQKLSLSSGLLQKSAAVSEQEARAAEIQRLKSTIHNRLVENIDVEALMQVEQSEALEAAIERTVHILIDEEKLPLTPQERAQIAKDVLYETLGLGPLEPLLSDPQINDILVNGADDVWIDRDGKLEQTNIRFKDNTHLLHVIGRIVARVGRRVDESSPIVDARLPDGSRVNAIIPPLALDGPTLSIRRFRTIPFNGDDLIEKGTMSQAMTEFLGLSVQARLNILISGGTSAGKTTLLNVLSLFISDSERIVTIEDTAELRLQQRHVVRVESRPANIEGQGSINQRELVKNALRMRPDRIVVGEVRGAEALDMLQAMNTGHEGSLTTVHANSPRDALSRLETLVLLAGIELSQRSIREQIGSAFDLVVQIKRLPDGKRRVVSIAEITGVEEGVISMQELFEFKQEGLDGSRNVLGKHIACGLRPFHESKFRDANIELRAELFENTSITSSKKASRDDV